MELPYSLGWHRMARSRGRGSFSERIKNNPVVLYSPHRTKQKQQQKQPLQKQRPNTKHTVCSVIADGIENMLLSFIPNQVKLLKLRFSECMKFVKFVFSSQVRKEIVVLHTSLMSKFY